MEKYNKLTIIEVIGRTKGYKKIVKCICDCGKECTMILYAIKAGKTKSCGCSRIGKQNGLKHGLARSPVQTVWATMKQRCYNEKAENYSNYGGRGIAVCDEWRNNFEKFHHWMMANGWSKGLQIDRVDNEKNYCPENCRLVTPKENSFNRRDTIRIEKDGVWYSLKNYCETFNISYTAVIQRVSKKKWSPEDAVTIPIGKRTKRKT
jgi:hypothetical protein